MSERYLFADKAHLSQLYFEDILFLLLYEATKELLLALLSYQYVFFRPFPGVLAVITALCVARVS
jgi:hypothetical protein